MRLTFADPYRRTAALCLVAAAAGIIMQILGGWDYPVIPPGALILLAGAVFAVLPFRWAPVITVVVGAFILVGFVVSGDYVNLIGVGDMAVNGLVLAGKWLQLITSLVATVAAITALSRRSAPMRAGRA